jgi:hypothetical protein
MKTFIVVNEQYRRLTLSGNIEIFSGASIDIPLSQKLMEIKILLQRAASLNVLNKCNVAVRLLHFY